MIIELSDKVRDLGVILEKELNLRQHVNDTCKKAFSAIRSISRIRLESTCPKVILNVL